MIDPVWRLYARALQLAGKTATLLEWDDHIPTFDEVHHEALKANRFIAQPETADLFPDKSMQPLMDTNEH